MIFVPEAVTASGFYYDQGRDYSMNRQETVHISDCTLLSAEDHFDLSFREKIELCRLIDKLGVYSIDLCPIRQKKTDRLLIKSICSAVRYAAIAVPVDIMDEESIMFAWEAMKEAVKPRLQVAVPVSSVQMEYMLHIKPDAMIRKVDQTVRSCIRLTENVELIAKDATRSDPAFLYKLLSSAVESGVRTVTLCDSAGVMMPDEIYEWISGIKQQLPALSNVVIGFSCHGDLNMSDASAVAAVRAGAREIKAITCSGNAVSLSNIVRIMNIRGASFGVSTEVGVEQIRRIPAQVEMICQSSGRKKAAFDQEDNEEDSDYLLSRHDSFETLIHAAEKLGYDLNADDQQRIWNSFRQTAEKKESITLKELDAIIAAEAMQVPPAYHDIRYVINTGNQIGAMAHMKLMFHNQEIEGIASGDGAIDAAFNSVEQATGRHFELDDFQIRSVTEGREAMGETVVRLRWEGKLYSGRGISTDIVGAGIMAYINAVNKIVYEEEEA